MLKKRMEEAVDGEYQNFKAKGGAYAREHFFGRYPELRDMVSNLSDDDIWRLNEADTTLTKCMPYTPGGCAIKDSPP